MSIRIILIIMYILYYKKLDLNFDITSDLRFTNPRYELERISNRRASIQRKDQTFLQYTLDS